MASGIIENPKAFHTHIKSKRITREGIGPLKDKGGNSCLYLDVGEVLKEYFASVFTNGKDVKHRKINTSCIEMLGHFEVKVEQVLPCLKEL